MKLRYIPNLITILRLLLIAPVLYALLKGYFLFSLILFIVAGISDALDGLLARLYGWTSRFGSVVDPVADKLLLMGSFVTLFLLGLIPTWLMVMIVARDVWIMLGVVVYQCWIGRYEIAPSAVSKLNTFLQILLVPLVLLDLSLVHLPSDFLQGMMYAVFATSVASFFHYSWVWIGRVVAHRQRLESRAAETHIGVRKGVA